MADAFGRALTLQQRAAALGFDWPDAGGVRDKLDEELRELDVACTESALRQHQELGDVLLTLTNLARHLGVDPARALEDATARFARRFARIEAAAGQLPELGTPDRLAAMERLWQAAKEDGL